jgi:tRNA (adenine22-N1)-methyltransferase
MKRFDSIIKLIKPESNVIDVGCDHCLLAINLIKKNIVKHIYNIDKNIKPLNSGINNLTKLNYLKYTTNILGDGLTTNKIKHKIDYCVIAGVGAKTIIEILTKRNKNIKINSFILIPNNNSDLLRGFLHKQNENIVYEEIIKENGYFYNLIQTKGKKKQKFSKIELFFSKFLLNNKNELFIEMLSKRFLFLKNNKLFDKNKKLRMEYEHLKKVLN